MATQVIVGCVLSFVAGSVVTSLLLGAYYKNMVRGFREELLSRGY
jgi:hypothetical protein